MKVKTTSFELKINDLLYSGFDVWRIIDVDEDDYVVALLQSNINGPVDNWFRITKEKMCDCQ